MPAIAKVGSVVTVTPLDDVQVIYGPGNHAYITDRSPFSLKVSGLIEHLGEIVGVYGDVLTGHERYRGMTATLFQHLDNSDWRRDNLSHAQFKVGRGPARLNHNYPYSHPEGTDVDGYPIILRFASVDSRASEEPAIDSATKRFESRKPNKPATPNRHPRFAFDMLHEFEYSFLRSTFAVAAVGEPQC